MEDKYIVFRLERPFQSDGSFRRLTVVKESCFEYLKEFSVEGASWQQEDQIREAYRFAEAYYRDTGLRTVVVKGVMFG